MILARLLSPQDYGLIGMVTPVTGFLRIFREAGLHTATVQREQITQELISTVFWINLALGVALTLVLIPIASGLVAFYDEPRLYGITLALAATFTIEAATAQHQALLRRAMRFKVQAAIDIAAMVVGVGTGIGMALNGFDYWSLVGMQIALSLTTAFGTWLAQPWRPGLPRRGSGVGAMVRFGGFVTGANVFNYIFRNADNVLIGWRWGAAPLGLYQKAYGLLMLPITQVNAPISSVAVATLSRLQAEPARQRRYFIGGYTIVASISLPIVVGAALFAPDIVHFVLGEEWLAAVPVFQLLAPAALIGALLNPLGWMFISSGRADRQFRGAVVWCILTVAAFAIGLRHGPEGVAVGYSIVSAILALPLCCYALHGTPVRVSDLGIALLRPVGAVAAAGFLMWLIKPFFPADVPAAVRAIGGCAGLLALYAVLLLGVLRQWASYRDLLQHVLPGKKEAATP